MVHYFYIIFVMQYYMMWAGQAIICYYYKLQSWVVITLEPRLPCKERCIIFTRPPFPLRGLRGVWVWDYSGDKLLYGAWYTNMAPVLCFYWALFLDLSCFLFFGLHLPLLLNRNKACSYVYKCLHSKELLFSDVLFMHINEHKLPTVYMVIIKS